MRLFVDIMKVGLVLVALGLLERPALLVVVGLLAFAAWLARREEHAVVCAVGFGMILLADGAANPEGVVGIASLFVAAAVGFLRSPSSSVA